MLAILHQCIMTAFATVNMNVYSTGFVFETKMDLTGFGKVINFKFSF